MGILEVDVAEVSEGAQVVKLHAVGQVEAAAVGHVLDGDAVLVPPLDELDVHPADHRLVGPAVARVAEEHVRQPELKGLRSKRYPDADARRALDRPARLDHAHAGHLRRRRGRRDGETKQSRDEGLSYHLVAFGFAGTGRGRGSLWGDRAYSRRATMPWGFLIYSIYA